MTVVSVYLCISHCRMWERKRLRVTGGLWVSEGAMVSVWKTDCSECVMASICEPVTVVSEHV